MDIYNPLIIYISAIVSILIVIGVVWQQSEYFDSGSTGHVGALARARIIDGKVVGIDLIRGGVGYKIEPDIVFGGSAKRHARAATVIDRGSVVGIVLIDGGEGYKSTPLISFSENETVLGLLKEIKNILTATPSSGTPVSTSTMTEADINKYSEEYDKSASEAVKSNQAQLKTINTQLEQINSQKSYEARSATLAKSYGLPPPPVLYSDAQVKKLNEQKKQLSQPPRQLTKVQKAGCAVLQNQITALQDQIQTTSVQAESNTSLTYRVQQLSNQLDQLRTQYTATCSV